LDRTRAAFHRLLDGASSEELRRPSNGTSWTNRQLLFHMLLGYLILRALLTLVRVFGRLPAGVSRAYARLLNKATRPFRRRELRRLRPPAEHSSLRSGWASGSTG
jgi:hypothetical protein